MKSKMIAQVAKMLQSFPKVFPMTNEEHSQMKEVYAQHLESNPECPIAKEIHRRLTNVKVIK